MPVTSVYPPAHNDTYVKATTKYGTDYWPYFATDPAKSITGTHVGNAWLSVNGTATNQRFNIDLGSAKTVNRIYLENGHHEGGSTTLGIENFVLQGSNNASSLAQTDYSSDLYWTTIQSGLQAAEHVEADQADPQYFTASNGTAYQYYSLKIADCWGGSFMGFRRVVLQIKTSQQIIFME